ncbi:hypothetical protein FHG87_015208, partial [Trinorchestia longiramus]
HFQDQVIIGIRARQWFFFDMKRQADGSYAATYSDLVLPSDYPFNWHPNDPHYGNEICMAM